MSRKLSFFTCSVLVLGLVCAHSAFGQVDAAVVPDPADGAIDVPETQVLTWVADETAFLYDVYLGTDADLVAAGDASVLQDQVSEASFTPDGLERGITYYWKVDVTTGSQRASEVHPGDVWTFRVVDRNTENWQTTVTGDDPAYLDTFVAAGPYDIGALSGDITYEFVVKSNPDETQASMALIGRIGHGDTTVALKYEQWNNTGTYGATVFGVADYDYGVPTAPGEYTHLTFVSSEDAGTTVLYVNGVEEGSVASPITLAGIVGIGRAIRDPEGAEFIDDFDGDIFGVAIYDVALSADTIAKHSNSYFTPIAITDPNLLIYYNFETGEGTTVIDASGHGNHSEFMGTPEWTTGAFGGGLAFVREEVDYIQTIGTLGVTTNTVTVSGWVRHEETPQGWSGILTHRGSGTLGLQHNGAEGPEGAELRYMWGADQYWSFSSGLLIPNGEWYFAALAISPEQATLYLNGVEQTATNVAEHVPVLFDSEIRVARDHVDDRVMTSVIDEVRLYDKTLTDVEILKVMGVLSDVAAAGDAVQGVPNDEDWPGAETPDLAIDDNVETKYLHFKGDFDPDPGTGGTGLQITPSGTTVVTGLTLTTANDVPGRDPIAFELSGSNESIDGPYTVIASGDIVDFAGEAEWPRFTMNATPIVFDNDVAYKHYQLIFTAIRGPVGGSVNSMQIAEIELLGTFGPVAQWMLDDAEGAVAVDSSANGNDGTLVGEPVWVEGIMGGALDLDGVDDYVDCGASELFSFTDAFTLSVWINWRAPGATWQTVVAKGDNAWRLARGGDTQTMDFGFTAGGDRGWQAARTATEVPLGEWHHVAATIDTVEGAKIYLDGVLEGTNADTGGITVGDYPVYIGENSQQAGRFWDGLVDDVRLYDGVLSGPEISWLAKP